MKIRLQTYAVFVPFFGMLITGLAYLVGQYLWGIGAGASLAALACIVCVILAGIFLHLLVLVNIASLFSKEESDINFYMTLNTITAFGAWVSAAAFAFAPWYFGLLVLVVALIAVYLAWTSGSDSIPEGLVIPFFLTPTSIFGVVILHGFGQWIAGVAFYFFFIVLQMMKAAEALEIFKEVPPKPAPHS